MAPSQEENVESSRRSFLQALSAAGATVTAACGRTPDEPPPLLGRPVTTYGDRSPLERSARRIADTSTLEASASRTPLQDLNGIITPSSLHFERHHAGVPALDPLQHQLTIHGLVDRPLVFSVGDLKRLPSVSRIYFVECSGNGRSGWRAAPQPTAQAGHGLTSCSNWTGVPLSVLFEEVGVQQAGRWFVAEGADACRMVRSVPIEKAWDDALVAYGQNGEALRPEQGYPIRLLLPGWEGNASVKWLRRIKVVDQPVMARDETSKYTDLMPDGRARQFTFLMEAKSLITRPSAGQTLGAPGFHEISGLAWSGAGAITRVEVSADGGATWTDARLHEPVLSKAHTRFTMPWRWDGREAILAARCTDETGYVQPSREALVAARGMNSDYHFNAIQSWKVEMDGTVVDATA
jgi:sulfane dehydrogenase subunit SoxC